MITDNYYPKIGGVEYCVHALGEALGKLGHEVTVITRNVENHTIDDRHSFLTVRRISWFALFKTLISPSIKKHAFFSDFDVIHAHSLCSPMAIMGLLIATRMNKPHLLTSHSIYRGFAKYQVKLLAAIVDHVICVSTAVVTNMKSLNKNTVTYLIPNGVEVPSAVIQNGVVYKESNQIVIGTVARLTSKKNTADFVHIASLLLKTHRHLKFIIVGDGPQRKNLQKKACQLNIAQKIHFTGCLSRSEALAVMKQFDIFVLTSPYEAFGIVVLEAMHYQIPCVAYTNNGTADIITSGETGYLGSSINEMVRDISLLIKNPEQCKKIANKAALTIMQFQWDDVAERTVAIYQRLLSFV